MLPRRKMERKRLVARARACACSCTCLVTHKHTHTNQILETFNKIDDDGNMQLDNEEFGKAFALMGLKLASNNRDELFKKFDVDGSGTVDLNEFRQMVKTYLDSSEQEQQVMMDGTNIEQLCFFFEKFDENGDGEVDLEEFRVMIKTSRQAANLFTGSEDLQHLSERQMEGLLLYDDWPARHAGPDIGTHVCLGVCLS